MISTIAAPCRFTVALPAQIQRKPGESQPSWVEPLAANA